MFKLKPWFSLLFVSLLNFGIWTYGCCKSDNYVHRQLVEISLQTEEYYKNKKETSDNTLNFNKTSSDNKEYIYTDEIDIIP
jgi:hypothetical protein